MADPDEPSDPPPEPTQPRVVVAEVLVERPEGWKPDPGLSRAPQSDGPLAAVELANFGAPDAAPATGPADTLQMPPHRQRPSAKRMALNPGDTAPLPPHRTRSRENLEAVVPDETAPLPPHRTRSRANVEAFVPDQTVPLSPHPRRGVPERGDDPLHTPVDGPGAQEPLDSVDVTREHPMPASAPSQGSQAPLDSNDATRELPVHRPAAAAPSHKEARRDRQTAVFLLVVGLALVAGVWAALNQDDPSMELRGAPNVPKTASYGGGGGGGGKRGGGSSGGGNGGGMATKDSELLAANGADSNACVARCARTQARCAQGCGPQQKCREQCVTDLSTCESSCDSGAGSLFLDEDGNSSAPAGPVELNAEQRAAAQSLCRDDEGDLALCPDQEAKMEAAEKILRRMCGKDPDIPCPEE